MTKIESISGHVYMSVANKLRELIQDALNDDIEPQHLVGVLMCVLTDFCNINDANPEDFLVRVIRERSRLYPSGREEPMPNLMNRLQ